MKSKLALVIPTNEPEVAFRFFLSSMENLKSASERIVLLFNFQKPWTQSEIDLAIQMCEDSGIESRYTFNEYVIEGKGLIPFNKIRFDAGNLMPDANYFMLMDDDFSFMPPSNTNFKDAGNQLMDCLDYMDRNPDCGIVLFKGKRSYTSVPRYTIAPLPDIKAAYLTDKGIVLRNLGTDLGLVVPNEAVSLVGSDEEKIACSWRLSKGYYPAVMNNTQMRHYENTLNTRKDIETSDKALTGELMYGWNKKSILEDNANKFIRENYYEDFINGRGSAKLNLIDYDRYLELGGLDLSNQVEVDKRTISYGK